MKRNVLALLFIIAFIMSFVSCSFKEVEQVPEYIAEVAEDSIDLAGQTIIYGLVNDYFFDSDSTLGYINTTELGDLAIQRIKDVQDKYNCEIEFDYVSVGAQTVYNNAVCGAYVFDILSDETYDILKFTDVGVFLDLTTVDNLDVFDTTKWGNKFMNMSVMFDGAIYGVLPARHPLRLSNSIENIIVVNEDYIRDLVVTDPRDYFENGEWNWENFEECLKTFAHTDTMSNEYRYSLGAMFTRFSRELGTSNGSPLYTDNGDGTFSYGFFSDNAIAAYHQAYEWFFGALSDNVIEEGGNDPTLSNFTEGRTVMELVDAYMVLSKSNSIAYTMENFGLVPVPYGPNASGPEGYSTSYRAADFTLCIPITAKNYEVSALIIDAIYEPFEGYETREQVIEYLSRNYFRDPRDARFFIEMTDDEHVYYQDHHHDSGLFKGLMSGVTRAVESYKEKQTNYFKEYGDPIFRTLAMYANDFHE